MEYDSYNRITKVTSPDAGNEIVGQYWYDCKQDACVQAATWMSRKRPADQAGNLTSVSFPALPTSCGSGFRVRKLAKRKVAGEDRQVEVLYPSMYFGLEKHRTTAGTEIPNTTYAVNNIYLDGVRIAAVIPNGDARYYFTDQVDSVKVVADDNGRAVTRMEYMPYGETWFTEGDNNNAPKYNSQELDKESNLYYYNARHYDAGVARFVTADTVIPRELDSQSWNRYSYCSNNPIIYKDPSGHIPFIVAAAIVAIIEVLTVPREFGEADKKTGKSDPKIGHSNEQYAKEILMSAANVGGKVKGALIEKATEKAAANVKGEVVKKIVNATGEIIKEGQKLKGFEEKAEERFNEADKSKIKIDEKSIDLFLKSTSIKALNERIENDLKNSKGVIKDNTEKKE